MRRPLSPPYNENLAGRLVDCPVRLCAVAGWLPGQAIAARAQVESITRVLSGDCGAGPDGDGQSPKGLWRCLRLQVCRQ